MSISTEVNMLQWVRRLIRAYECRQDPNFQVTQGAYRFYMRMLKIWKKYREFQPRTDTEIRNESLWFNNLLGPGPPPNIRTYWQRIGIHKIGHVCHTSKDRLLSHSKIAAKFGVSWTFLEALSLRASILEEISHQRLETWPDKIRHILKTGSPWSYFHSEP